MCGRIVAAAMPDLTTVADVPDLTALSDDLPTGRIVVAKLGSYTDKRYGAFGITEQHLASWQRNLAACFDGRAAIDFDHSPEKGQGTKAAAWITSLERKSGAELQAEDATRFARLDPTAIYAASNVEFSAAGAKSIRDKEYRYISPTFVDDFTDEAGAKHGPALIGAGLTNRPFLRKGMPAISLSADEYQEPAQSVAEPSDSRGRMPDLTAIAKKLGLDENADEAKILSFIPESATGVKVLSGEEYAGLLSRASAGDAAVASLQTTKFETAWTKALDEGRVAPANEDDFKSLAEINVDLAVKTLDGLAKIVPTKPAGSGNEKTLDEDAPEGVDQERFELDQKVQARMLANGDDDYTKALGQVMATEGNA